MNYELRKIIPAVVISLAFVRFWIEIVTAIIFKNSNLINQINNNRVGFHHWQLGVVIFCVAIILGKLNTKSGFYTNSALGLGFALFLDQYTYVLHLTGIYLPFEYRSKTDYLIIGSLVIVLILYWSYLRKSSEK